MDYVKRDQIRDEIDILINRIVVLQEQEKTYKDLTNEIETHLNTLNSIDKQIDDRVILLEEKTAQIEGLEALNLTIREEWTDEWNLRQKLYQEVDKRMRNSMDTKKEMDEKIESIKKTLVKLEKELKEKEEEIVKAQNRLDDLNNGFISGQKEIVMEIEKNRMTIETQNDEINKNKETIKELILNIQEIDKDYTKSLENYIVTL